MEIQANLAKFIRFHSSLIFWFQVSLQIPMRENWCYCSVRTGAYRSK